MLDADTVGSDTSYEAALLAAGAAIEAARARRVRARPPARAPRAAGARRWASACSTTSRSPRGTRRPSSGSSASRSSTGTSTTATAREAIFADDDSVLFVSLHQWPFYPGTGGAGRPGADDGERPAAGGLRRRGVRGAPSSAVVEPAVRAFEPDLVLVSAGFDAHERDPLAEMRVTEDGFRELARRSAALGPRVAAVLEGGYNVETLPRLVARGARGLHRELGPKTTGPSLGRSRAIGSRSYGATASSPFPWKRTI